MPDSPSRGTGRFLGVRLTPEEEALLERYRAERGIKNRSEAVRALLRDTGGLGAGRVALPVSRLRELEDLVEDGYFSTLESALEQGLEAGLRELVRTHTEGVPALRRLARESRERSERRRRADREGRGLLGR